MLNSQAAALSTDVLSHKRSSSRSLFTVLFAAILLAYALAAAQAAAKAASLNQPAPAGQLTGYLESDFCREGLCENGNWKAWIILSADSDWTEEELEMVRMSLNNTIRALNDMGFDGRALLAGYRFRRHQAQFIDGNEGHIATILYGPQEILLSDAAFRRLEGFYIYHELGHAVDHRLGKELRSRYLAHTGYVNQDGRQEIAGGYWLNDFARTELDEAAADAFALWVVMHYTNNMRPVFAHTPADVSYEAIVGVMVTSLRELAAGA